MTTSETPSAETRYWQEPEVNDGLCDLACLIMLVTSDERQLLLTETLSVGRLKIKKRFELRSQRIQIEKLEAMLYGVDESQLNDALDLVFAKPDKSSQRRADIALARSALSSSSQSLDSIPQNQEQERSGSCETDSSLASGPPVHVLSPNEQQ